MMTTLTARPEAITFDPQQTALIVVDMQNAYATPGGYLDLAGFDVSTTRPVIANIQTAVTAARTAGMLIIWFQNGWDEQYVEAGDIVLPKPRYSGFFNTPLDSILRSRGIRHLVFTGIATNVCVESTLRDGFFLEYFGVVLEDATHQAGPEFAQKAALFNIETFFGWVSDVETFCDALSSTSFARIA